MPELLAPAGNMEALMAAVNAGCDAVYLGMNKFGARAYAENFDFESLKEAIVYCHLHNVKIFVTMNTIVFEEELPLAYEQIDNLYLMGVDAIIIQDIALLDYVNRRAVEMEAHASTQMGLDDVNGVLMAKEFGAKRVVLGRECDIEKVLSIKKTTKMPIEIFAHGALCVAYSGNCLMSGLIGYRSGNRGRCVGSCRKPYELIDITNGKSYGETYLLSMKDLQTIDNLKALKHIDSLKIEGRMKEPSYVYNVVKNYREALTGKVTEKNILDLTKTFNRTYTKGYLFNEDKKVITNINKPNHHGYYIGYVSDIDGKQVELTLEGELHQNDVIRIDSYEEVNYPVVKLYDENDRLIRKANQRAYIYLEEKVKINDKVYITKDTQFLNQISKNMKIKTKRVPIGFHVYAAVGYPLILTATTNDGTSVTVESDFKLVKANKKIDVSSCEKQLSRLNDTPYALDYIEFSGEDAFIPSSILNDLRREVIEKMNSIRLERKRILVPLKKDKALGMPLSERGLSVFCTTEEQYDTCMKLGIENLYYANYIPRNEANYKDVEGTVLVGGYGGIKHYQGKNNYIVSDFSLNVVNARSVYLLHKANVKRVTISHEMNKKDINDLIKQYYADYQEVPNLEMIIYGRAHLLNTKYCPLKVFDLCGLCKKNQFILKDNYGEFPLVSHENCTTTILNGKILNLLDDLDNIPAEIKTLRLQFTKETAEEVTKIVKLAQAKLLGNSDKTFDSEKHTRGHFNREII